MFNLFKPHGFALWVAVDLAILIGTVAIIKFFVSYF